MRIIERREDLQAKLARLVEELEVAQAMRPIEQIETEIDDVKLLLDYK